MPLSTWPIIKSIFQASAWRVNKIVLSVGLWLIAVSAFGQQEVGVDKFTGTAQVNIPLYSLQAGEYSFPIQLNHSASGVKVEDAGGLMGVNWSLDAEVLVTREVRGLPDDINVASGAERRYGWLVAGVPARAAGIAAVVENASACSSDEQQAYTGITTLLETTANGVHTMYDSEPDVYAYNLPGYSGKFIFTAQGQVHLIPFAPLQITYSQSPTGAPTYYRVRDTHSRGSTLPAGCA